MALIHGRPERRSMRREHRDQVEGIVGIGGQTRPSFADLHGGWSQSMRLSWTNAILSAEIVDGSLV